MARLPAAPGANGEPPVPPVEASKVVTPASTAAITLASAVPRVSWKCRPIMSEPMPAAASAPSTRLTSAGAATPTVSLIASSSTPMARRRSDTATTAPASTSPSYGQPKAALT